MSPRSVLSAPSGRSRVQTTTLTGGASRLSGRGAVGRGQAIGGHGIERGTAVPLPPRIDGRAELLPHLLCDRHRVQRIGAEQNVSDGFTMHADEKPDGGIGVTVPGRQLHVWNGAGQFQLTHQDWRSHRAAPYHGRPSPVARTAAHPEVDGLDRLPG